MYFLGEFDVARTYDSRKRVLVTGGAGFLGSHLIDRILADGHEVLCIDNLFTGTKRNIEHLHSNPRFEFMRHDVTFPLYVEVDEIYNLACPASPIHYQHDPVQTTKTSVHGAINMLGLAKRLRCRILQASIEVKMYQLATAAGRSQTAPAEYFAGEGKTRLGAKDQIARWS
jgi:UDP-glucuronate decarboxylase